MYSNDTQPTSTQTTCLATAEWSGQDGLECWKGRFVLVNNRNDFVRNEKFFDNMTMPVIKTASSMKPHCFVFFYYYYGNSFSCTKR